MDAVTAPRASVFISFNSRDEEFATALYRSLHERGVPVFYAPATLRLGQDAIAEINDALESCRIAIVIWSAGAKDSAWVNNEANYFTDRRNRGGLEIVIVRLDETPVPPLLRQLQRIDQAGPGDARRIADEIVGQLGPIAATGTPGTPTLPRRVPVSVDDLKDAICLRLAGELSQHAVEIRAAAHPAQISIEVGDVRFVARVNAGNLSMWAPLIEMNGALDRIPDHTEALQKLKDREMDPYNLAPTSRKIQMRLKEVADEYLKIREALGLFLHDVWKEESPVAQAT
jgi:hypothetical protein